MIYITAGSAYYTTQVYFVKNILDLLPNDEKIWAKEYRKWLASQGAKILHVNDRNLIRNSLDIAPYYDKFVFENDSDATMFMLRWG